jgi:hypothetical protein
VAEPNRDGFTGMEALWNFFYWQALTTNPLDDIGHVLRLSIVVNPVCGSYQVKPSPQVIAQCNQFLGPTQPGVTTADPTRSGATSASSEPPAAPAKSDKNAALDFLLGQ